MKTKQKHRKTKGRIILYPKDIASITGKKEWAVRTLMNSIRKTNGKPAHSLITVDDFCKHTGVTEDEIEKFID